MGIRLRRSRQTLALLDAMLAQPSEWHHGYSLSQKMGLASGTLYPILMRLEQLDWLETRWETNAVPGRPPRHLYRLSADGRSWAQEELGAANASKFLKNATSEVEP